MSALNIEGDRQADLSVHGGEDKAVYAYSFDTYPKWKEILGLNSLEYGAMGENLTLDHLDETQVCVGDVFELGTCQLEAVQPRFPCFKLALKYNDPSIVQAFNRFLRSGVYFRVRKEGKIETGNELKLTQSEEIKVSIHELFRFYLDHRTVSSERAAEIARVPSLNGYWKEKFIQIARF
ncbi:MAG: MOSC domain-containing protein [Bdellovibrionota bacterium]